MATKVLTLFKIIKKQKIMALVFLFTIPCVIIHIINDQLYPKLLGQLKKANTNYNSKTLSLFLFCLFNEIIVDFSIDILSHIYDFYTEKSISFYLYNQLYNLMFDEFEKKTPDEHYSEFLIKKDAFVNMLNIILFSFPVNMFSCMLHLYNLTKVNFLFNFFVFSCVFSIYYFFTNKGVSYRKRLRDQLNSSKISKNRFCKKSIDNFEICKAFSREKSFNFEFSKLHWKMSLDEIKYFIVSENFRLATRSILCYIKIAFILIKLRRNNFDIGSIFIRIDSLNSRIIAIRNNVYYFLEYWNELKDLEIDKTIEEENICENSNSRKFIGDMNDIETSDENLKKFEIFVKITNKCLDENNHLEIQNEISNNSDDLLINNERSYKHCLRIFSEATEFTSKNIYFLKNKKILLVGPQGSGKTSLLNELIGLRSRYWNFEKFQSQNKISFCTQNQKVFNKSILFNLSYGSDLDENQIKLRLKSLNLLKIFESFENGLHTVVGSKLTGLSGGQRQLICLVRCFLRDADIYIFDKPKLFLDEENIRLFFELVKSIDNKTVIMTANDNTDEALFDQIVYLR